MSIKGKGVEDSMIPLLPSTVGAGAGAGVGWDFWYDGPGLSDKLGEEKGVCRDPGQDSVPSSVRTLTPIP